MSQRPQLENPVGMQVFDRITPKAMRPLQRTQRVFRSVTTSDDPVVRCACHAVCCCRLAHACPEPDPEGTAVCRQLAGEDKARVFATDTVLTTLMCAARSVYSWDVVVTRAGDKLFFDSR